MSQQMRFKDCDSWCAYDFEKPDTIAGNTWRWELESRQEESEPQNKKNMEKNRLYLGGGFRYFFFIPSWGNDPILINIFPTGWNHQLDIVDVWLMLY